MSDNEDNLSEKMPRRDEAVDAVLAEFGGDPRAAIAALLHDIDVLAGGYDASVSRGFIRRKVDRRS